MNPNIFIHLALRAYQVLIKASAGERNSSDSICKVLLLPGISQNWKPNHTENIQNIISIKWFWEHQSRERGNSIAQLTLTLNGQQTQTVLALPRLCLRSPLHKLVFQRSGVPYLSLDRQHSLQQTARLLSTSPEACHRPRLMLVALPEVTQKKVASKLGKAPAVFV